MKLRFKSAYSAKTMTAEHNMNVSYMYKAAVGLVTMLGREGITEN
jgi:hypothetical protein